MYYNFIGNSTITENLVFSTTNIITNNYMPIIFPLTIYFYNSHSSPHSS